MAVPRVPRFPIRAVLIDLSGTLHIGENEIPGSIAALKRLRASDVHVKFVTNTTKESRRALHERLISIGFEIRIDEIFSSLWAARELVATRRLNPLLLVDDLAMEDFSGLTDDNSEPDSVVVGLAPDKFDYHHMNTAYRLLTKRADAPLIAIHAGRYYQTGDGLSLGPGAFVRGLEYAAERHAEVVGKPSGAFFHAALSEINPLDAVMIGDDVRDDIAGAQSLGIRGLLVQTGKYREGDETKISPPPHGLCPDFADAVDAVLTGR